MPRQSKTTKALAVIVMGEIGLHDELKKEITGVTIRKTERTQSEGPSLTGRRYSRRSDIPAMGVRYQCQFPSISLRNSKQAPVAIRRPHRRGQFISPPDFRISACYRQFAHCRRKAGAHGVWPQVKFAALARRRFQIWDWRRRGCCRWLRPKDVNGVRWAECAGGCSAESCFANWFRAAVGRVEFTAPVRRLPNNSSILEIAAPVIDGSRRPFRLAPRFRWRLAAAPRCCSWPRPPL